MKLKITLAAFLLGLHSNGYAALYAPVNGFAHSFTTAEPLADGTVTVLENGLQLKTDHEGKFGPIYWPVDTPITMVFTKPGYHTTQTATMTVPAEGLTGAHHNVTFQVPDEFAYLGFAIAMGVTLDESKCHVVTTITARGKNLDDLPQGEPDTKAILIPDTSYANPFYFGVFTDGPLKDKTNPFMKGLTLTSVDGGVVFANVLPSDKPYVLMAEKNGLSFTQTQFICRKGMFINISPPQGPIVL